MYRTVFVGTQSHDGFSLVSTLNSGVVQRGVGRKGKQERSNSPRFPSFLLRWRITTARRRRIKGKNC